MSLIHRLQVLMAAKSWEVGRVVGEAQVPKQILTHRTLIDFHACLQFNSSRRSCSSLQAMHHTKLGIRE